MEKEKENENLEEESALLKAYKNLEENSVSKEKYEKDMAELREKNNLYLKAITEGSKVDSTSESIDLQKEIQDLSEFKGTNLQYWTKTCKAIDETLKKMDRETIEKMIGYEGLEELIKVNEGMKSMVEQADGDPAMFRAIYNRKVKESSPKLAAEIEKSGGLVGYLEKRK